MKLSINDTFSTKEETIAVVKEFASYNNIKNEVEVTDRLVSIICKGKKEFGCEAQISATLRKKDGKYVIKRLRLNHKCPDGIKQFDSTTDFIKAEIDKIIGDDSVRTGEVVRILADNNIKVSYFSVWKALNRRKIKDKFLEEKHSKENVDPLNVNVDLNLSNEGFKRRKVATETFNASLSLEMRSETDHAEENTSTFIVDHEVDNEEIWALEDYLEEFKSINPGVFACYKEKMFFFMLPEHIENFLPVVEIKVYRKSNGFVIYGVIHDPTDQPLIYSCLVAENVVVAYAYEYFFSLMPVQTNYLVDFDMEIIDFMEKKGFEFYIKTRELCKCFYAKNKSIDLVKNIWEMCNGNGNVSFPELDNIPANRYIRSKCRFPMFGLQNTSECDVDFVYFAVYNFSFFECINAILKLYSDNLKQRKRSYVQETKVLFGHNVLAKLDDSWDVNDDNAVNLEDMTCTCGRYQELLIPCKHACKFIRDAKEEPLNYICSIYKKEQILRATDIVPVVDMIIRCQSDRHVLRRGPGRPKKFSGRLVEAS